MVIASAPPTFEQMYRAEFPFVFNVLRRFGARPRDLEDLAHDVFLAAYKSQSRFDPSRSLRPWLTGIAFRVTSDYVRLARHGREVPEDGESQQVPDAARSPLETVEANQARDVVQRALQRIELGRRAVFVMHEIEGMPVAQVASALEIPEGTAWSRLRQARAEFGAAVKQLQQGGQP